MKEPKRRLSKSHYPFSFSEPSYESYVFSHLYHLYLFLEAERQPHAFFGGTAVAAYSGHLPRRLHDIDLIVPEGEEGRLVSHMYSESFREQTTRKAKRANFRKFLYEDDRYQIIVSVFPGKFTLLDLTNSTMPPIGTYDFSVALERRNVRFIHALGGQGEVPVVTVPIEDLIITKLWPTLEPKSILDLSLLLCSDAASRLDFSYLAARVKQSEKICSVTLQTLKRFVMVYDKSLWSRSPPKREVIRTQVRRIINALDSTNATPAF